MKHLTLLLILVTMTALSSSFTPEGNTTRINITITGFESNKGQALVRVYKSAEGFPQKGEKAIKILTAVIKEKTSSLQITDLPPGTYAIAASHDINKNKEIDRNWVGFPKEPVGMSNYPKMAKPNFEKAKFTLEANETKNIEIKVNTIF